MVGSTEYAAIYGTLVDALDGCEEDVVTPADFACIILDEFIGHAERLRQEIAVG